MQNKKLNVLSAEISEERLKEWENSLEEIRKIVLTNQELLRELAGETTEEITFD